eukprot:g13704.t1
MSSASSPSRPPKPVLIASRVLLPAIQGKSLSDVTPQGLLDAVGSMEYLSPAMFRRYTVRAAALLPAFSAVELARLLLLLQAKAARAGRGNRIITPEEAALGRPQRAEGGQSCVGGRVGACPDLSEILLQHEDHSTHTRHASRRAETEAQTEGKQESGAKSSAKMKGLKAPLFDAEVSEYLRGPREDRVPDEEDHFPTANDAVLVLKAVSHVTAWEHAISVGPLIDRLGEQLEFLTVHDTAEHATPAHVVNSQCESIWALWSVSTSENRFVTERLARATFERLLEVSSAGGPVALSLTPEVCCARLKLVAKFALEFGSRARDPVAGSTAFGSTTSCAGSAAPAPVEPVLEVDGKNREEDVGTILLRCVEYLTQQLSVVGAHCDANEMLDALIDLKQAVLTVPVDEACCGAAQDLLQRTSRNLQPFLALLLRRLPSILRGDEGGTKNSEVNSAIDALEKVVFAGATSSKPSKNGCGTSNTSTFPRQQESENVGKKHSDLEARLRALLKFSEPATGEREMKIRFPGYSTEAGVGKPCSRAKYEPSAQQAAAPAGGGPRSSSNQQPQEVAPVLAAAQQQPPTSSRRTVGLAAAKRQLQVRDSQDSYSYQRKADCLEADLELEGRLNGTALNFEGVEEKFERGERLEVKVGDQAAAQKRSKSSSSSSSTKVPGGGGERAGAVEKENGELSPGQLMQRISNSSWKGWGTTGSPEADEAVVHPEDEVNENDALDFRASLSLASSAPDTRKARVKMGRVDFNKGVRPGVDVEGSPAAETSAAASKGGKTNTKGSKGKGKGKGASADRGDGDHDVEMASDEREDSPGIG